MRLALAAALLGPIALTISEHYRQPGATEDQHDALIAAPDSALVPKPSVRTAPPGRVSFAVKFKEEVSPFPVLGMFVMPGERVPIEAVFTDSTVRYTAEAAGGHLTRLGPSPWGLTAPEKKGMYPLWGGDSVFGATRATLGRPGSSRSPKRITGRWWRRTSPSGSSSPSRPADSRATWSFRRGSCSSWSCCWRRSAAPGSRSPRFGS